MTTGVDILDLMDIPERASMNEDLVSFMDHQVPESDHAAASRDRTTTKKLGGPCSFCSQRAAARCLRCERPSCGRHRHTMTGLCQACMGVESDGRSGYGADEEDVPPGRPDLDISWVD